MKAGYNRKAQTQQQRRTVKRAFRHVTGQARKLSVESEVRRLAKKGLLARAAQMAVEKQLANGVPAVWMEGGVVYKQHPDGKKEVLALEEEKSRKLSRQKLFIQ